jgi:crossover junction endodeoxyribonuclease RusA
VSETEPLFQRTPHVRATGLEAKRRRTKRLLITPLHGAVPPTITVTVFGLPRPQGSMTAWRDPQGRQHVKYTNTLHMWRGLVTEAVRRAGEGPRIEGPIQVSIVFELPRPRGHFGSGRNAGRLRPGAPAYPAVGGNDLDKLVRGVLDAVTDAGTVWADDAQVIRLCASKLYCAGESVPGCTITMAAAKQ